MSVRRRILCCLALCLALPGAFGGTDAVSRAGTEESGWRRFVVYPHLEKGWEAVREGKRDRAIAEFRRACQLAPTNPLLARYLASAHRHFGELPAAAEVLRGQLKHTPRDAAVREDLFQVMYAQLPAKGAPRAGALASWIAAERDEAARDRLARELEYLKAELGSTDKVQTAVAPAQSPASAAPAQPPAVAARAQAIPKAARAAAPQRRAGISLPAQAPQILQVPPDKEALARAEFDAAMERKDYVAAEAFAVSSLPQTAAQPGLLDSMTYQLTEAGADRAARNLLLAGYPFAQSPAAERELLLQRLVRLLLRDPQSLEASQLDLLRAPLDTAPLRSQQSVFWETMRDCDGVRAVLANGEGDRSYSDWMRLGKCYRAREPGLAQHAFKRASLLRPEAEAIKSLAYQAYANADHAAALQAWQRLGVDALSSDELLAAARTASDAKAPEAMRQWLAAFVARNPAGSPEYWSLEAERLEKTDAAGAAAALERAIALRPAASDYLRLASLQRDPQAKLRSLESAAVLAPTDADVQVALGYAYLATGDSRRAADSLEAARKGRPDDGNLLEQLVYVHERLANNETARRYARLRLDALSAAEEGRMVKPAASPSDDSAEKPFQLMRMHEGLGRRLTVSLDITSGTGMGAAGATGTPAGQPGQGSRSYSQLEVDYRLGTPPVRDGRTLSAYARVFADGGAEGSAWPDQSRTLGVGLRWKPLRDQVLYLAAERQVPLQGDGRKGDWLLRASASFLNSGRYSDDWHPSGSGWVSRNLYLDLARYTESRRTAATADYRLSYHHKIAPGQTVEPYAHVQYNAIKEEAFQRDVRIGFGVRWNLWHGATQYDAYPHKLFAAIEVQHALKTYLPDRNTVFVSLGYRW